MIGEYADLLDLLYAGFHEYPPRFIRKGDAKLLQGHKDSGGSNHLSRKMNRSFGPVYIVQESP